MNKNITIKTKLIGGFIIIGLIVLIVGLVGLRGSLVLSDKVAELSKIEMVKIEKLLKIKVEFEQGRNVIDALLNPELSFQERNALWDKLAQIRKNYTQYKKIYANLPRSKEEDKEWKKFLVSLKAWKEVDDRYFALAKEIQKSGITNPIEFWAVLEKYKGYHFRILEKIYKMFIDKRVFAGSVKVDDCIFTSWLDKLQVDNKSLKRDIQDLKECHKCFHNLLVKIKELFSQKKIKEAKDILQWQLYPKSNDMFLCFERLISTGSVIKNKYDKMVKMNKGVVLDKQRKTFFHLEKLLNIVSKNAELKVREAENISKEVVWYCILGMSGGVILALGLGLLLTRMIIGPLRKTVDFAQEVARGNLDAKLEFDRNDEIGNLVKAINQMLVSLREKILEAKHKTEEAESEKIKATKALAEAEEARRQAEMAKKQGMQEAASKIHKLLETLTLASDNLSSQVEQTVKGTRFQQESLEEIATAMEEMNASVLEIAKNSSGVAASSEQAQARAKEGESLVGEMADKVQLVQQKAKETKVSIDELGRRVEKIGSIITVIEDIADQTNLLALNAAIEAARAGDVGRGFAVVADEVRKLAEKTMSATKEVAEVIANIQTQTKESINSVDRVAKTIENTTVLAKDSGQALKEIVDFAQRVASQIQAIATATEEQSATSEEVSRSIEDVNRIAGETSEVMQHAFKNLKQVSELIDELEAIVQSMRQE
ncbi:Chemoreceptor zinc-binding domain-containing protein [Desulfonauticus submarinus]|uniref:Chemoreceptor zinc-binding domain-containing protein n=1 Tax=Desulfonauticus submarinus TaxID=206665 RepID=A0A1H0E2G3_9BACT|nr:HAMP domain-containing methyl-accepting chemotaxis protein [Desulfonauticus submarinus]SDN76592.1 Chemoreceptor zinc-binding domain-containing protein [Desulfonauticus submarinus]